MTAARADIRSVVVLGGLVVADPPIAIKSTVRGSVADLPAAVGTLVGAHGVLFTLASAGAGEVQILAPTSGIVTEVGIFKGEEVIVGQTLATFAPKGFQIVAPIEPTLLYRFYQPPTDIVARIQKGPAPFPCMLLSLGIASITTTRPFDAPVELRCRVPPDQIVFSGVRADVAVTTGEAKAVVAIPVTAVEGQVDSGFVTVIDASDVRHRKAVRLGVTDGVLIEVKEGLAAGDRLLDLPPSLFPGDAEPTRLP